jgi:hypothetical protein
MLFLDGERKHALASDINRDGRAMPRVRTNARGPGEARWLVSPSSSASSGRGGSNSRRPSSTPWDSVRFEELDDTLSRQGQALCEAGGLQELLKRMLQDASDGFFA